MLDRVGGIGKKGGVKKQHKVSCYNFLQLCLHFGDNEKIFPPTIDLNSSSMIKFITMRIQFLADDTTQKKNRT